MTRLIVTALCLLLVPLVSGATNKTKEMSANPMVTMEAYPAMKHMRLLVDSLALQEAPKRHYKALLDASPELSTSCANLVEMKYATHNKQKQDAFHSHKEELGRLVAEYADAASRFDSTAILKLVREMRTQCDSVVVCLLPVRWKAYDRLRETVYEVFGKGAFSGDREFLSRSLTKVKGKLGSFVKDNAPVQISTSLAELIPEEKQVLVKLSAKMTSSLEKNDLESFRYQAMELNTRIMNFSLQYLQ